MRRPPRPRLVHAVEVDAEVFQPPLGGDPGEQQRAEHERQRDVERVVAGVDGGEADEEDEGQEAGADARQANHAVELPSAC